MPPNEQLRLFMNGFCMYVAFRCFGNARLCPLQFPVRLRNEAASGELFRNCTHPLNVFAVVLYATQLSDPYTFAKVLDNYMEAFMNLKVPVG